MYNIAITGVGGGVGQSILKSLDSRGYHLFALDGESLAAGLFVTENACLIPYANHPDYIPELLNICRKNNISILFPGLDAELLPLSLNREKFNAVGTQVIVSNPEVVRISDDKQETFDQLTKLGLKVPFTSGLGGYILDTGHFPLIIKQKIGGARSKNVFLAKSLNDWNAILEKIGDKKSAYIVQEFIEGDEYTCGSITLGKECKGVIVMRRILRDGDTYKCFSVKNKIIEDVVRTTVNLIQPFGACNIQLRLKDNVPYIFEINARCSGTTASRTLCGFNEPKMIADYLLQGKEPRFEIQEKTILRYWKELVVENEEVITLEKQKTLTTPAGRHL